MNSLDRRQLLMLTGGLAAAQVLPGCASGPRPGDASSAESTLAAMAEELLGEFPENASVLGIDKDTRASLKVRLTDRSPQGVSRHASAVAARIERLNALDTSVLDEDARTDLDVVKATHALAAEGLAFPFGDVALLNYRWSFRNSPYVVTQNLGAFVEIPDFLDTFHKIESVADAGAYLMRLEAYAQALDGETARLRHDAGLGVLPPSFLLDKTLKQMEAARAAPVTGWSFLASFARKTASFGGNHAAAAATIARDRIVPGLDRQIAELTRQRARATDDAGVWKVPEGEAYYGWALRAATTSALTPDQVHQMGLDQLAMLSSQMDGLLKAQGLTKGSVGARMIALGKDPKNLYANTDEGRAKILAYCEEVLADIRVRLPRAFNTLVPARLVVRRVPVEVEAGAPRGYAGAGSIDGTAPGNYYVNLRDTAIWPRYALPTLSYHEAIPGHVWQGEYTYRLPLIRSLLSFNAYSEGWGLYAEQLADELGVYDGDPLGKLGYLQSMAYRACRLVVDTGLHSKRWTRQYAIRWFAEASGQTENAVTSDVDRYCAWPGQACGYKVGHTEIGRLRDKAVAAMGTRYDPKAFNDAVVKTGGVPLTVLERVVDRHIAGGRA